MQGDDAGIADGPKDAPHVERVVEDGEALARTDRALPRGFPGRAVPPCDRVGKKAARRAERSAGVGLETGAVVEVDKRTHGGGRAVEGVLCEGRIKVRLARLAQARRS